MAAARPLSTVRTDPGERFNNLVGVVLRLNELRTEAELRNGQREPCPLSR